MLFWCFVCLQICTQINIKRLSTYLSILPRALFPSLIILQQIFSTFWLFFQKYFYKKIGEIKIDKENNFAVQLK